jgi:hypothetical protein
MEWTNSSGDSQFMLEWQSTSQGRQVVPQDRLLPKAEPIKRFETHIAFSQRTTFDQFCDRCCSHATAVIRTSAESLGFFDRRHVAIVRFRRDEHQKNTFKFYPRFTQQELFNLPNRFVASGRDLNDRYLANFRSAALLRSARAAGHRRPRDRRDCDRRQYEPLAGTEQPRVLRKTADGSARHRI